MIFDKGIHAAKPTPAESRAVTSRSTKTDIAKVKTYMAQHYNLPLSIADLAARANISPKYFVDLFKKTYGQSAMEYLTDLRINHAKRYLKESGDKLRDIALKVGYSDEYYFSRKFKKEVGISPSDYARTTKKRIATYSSNMIGQLLALGVMPVAAPIDSKWTAYYYNVYRTEISSHLKLTDPYTSWRMEANVEKLVHIRPDAIIGNDQISEQDKTTLAKIAPCCVVPKLPSDWRTQLRTIAAFLEREEQAEQWINGYHQRVQEAREHVQREVGQEKVIVLRLYGQHLYHYSNRGIEEVFHHALQLDLLMDVSANVPITLEQLAAMNPDRMLVMVCPEAASRATWLRLQHSSLWRQLKAAQHYQIHLIAGDPWFDYSAVGVMRMLSEALLMFTGYCPNGYLDTVHGDSQVT
ncbi:MULTISPECIES: ABC transporter substrate-binding protein [unclassified Paenibacillus]|uniref:ABC transporter substrate-binding protein n=1 Tax=unclassified Paenibacillus TaxID=185978 RepID=UPI000FE1985D|nr:MULTISPECIES: AraC family transcriptional regulator [unclassified Paenibacillus]MCM3173741.1 AraC family transcriptional regulator [Paenibacillus sp. MER 99-2]